MAKQAVGTNVGTGSKTSSPKGKRSSVEPREEGYGRFDFVKLSPLISSLSLILTILSLVVIATKGFNYGIDFAGGTEIQVKFPQDVVTSDLRAAIAGAGVGGSSVQSFGSQQEFLIRLETPSAPTEKAVNDLINSNVARLKAELSSKFALQEEGLLRVDTVGPQIGSELKRNGLLAVFYSFLVILIYVALRFDYKFAPGAVLCLVHDTIVTMGVFALLGREVNVQIMAAILTLIGYSLNDTIVTFDRIRETIPQFRERSLRFIINRAINDMLSRTAITTGTTLAAVLALYFLATGVISDIAFTLAIGILIGTYSSIYVAAPLVLIMDKFKRAAA